MKPSLPLLNVQLKICKGNVHIRPAVNNVHAPSYKMTFIGLSTFILPLCNMGTGSTCCGILSVYHCELSLNIKAVDQFSIFILHRLHVKHSLWHTG